MTERTINFVKSVIENHLIETVAEIIAAAAEDETNQKNAHDNAQKDPRGKTYDDSYDALRYAGAACRQERSENNIKILALAVYGWMPTVLDIAKEYDGQPIEMESVKSAIQFAENWKQSGTDNIECAMKQFEILARFIDNSYVGASKFLHFLFPDSFAIFDSNIAEVLNEKKKLGRDLTIEKRQIFSKDANKPANFILYELAMRKIAENNPKIGILRDVEQVLFYGFRSEEERRGTKKAH